MEKTLKSEKKRTQKTRTLAFTLLLVERDWGGNEVAIKKNDSAAKSECCEVIISQL